MKRQSPTRKETFDYYSFLSKFVCSIRRTAGLSKNDEASSVPFHRQLIHLRPVSASVPRRFPGRFRIRTGYCKMYENKLNFECKTMPV